MVSKRASFTILKWNVIFQILRNRCRLADRIVGMTIRIAWHILHELPTSHLMEGDGIGIAAQEFVGLQSVNRLGTANAFLFPIDEDGHELLFAALPFAALCCGEFFLHGNLANCHLEGQGEFIGSVGGEEEVETEVGVVYTA